MAGLLRVDIDFYFARPQRLLGSKHAAGPIRKGSKPDRDNLDKAVLDALTKAGLWEDDDQVCAGEPCKWSVAQGGVAGARVVVTALEESPPALLVESGSLDLQAPRG